MSTVSTTSEGLRDRARRLVESNRFNQAIAGVILVNAVTLGMETSDTAMRAAGDLLYAVDRVALGIFVVELLIKFYAYRLRFFRSGWNVFDFLIVGISLIPASGNLSVLRSLRILRALRLVSVVPTMRRVVQALFSAIPGMLSIIAVLFLIFYVSAVMATKLFGQSPDPNMQEWFGTIGQSMYSLFQIMTLESWSMGIVRPTMELFPHAWAFFVPFIVMTSFAVLNLFIAIIVGAMQGQHDAERAEQEADIRRIQQEEQAAVTRELAGLRAEVAALRAAVERST